MAGTRSAASPAQRPWLSLQRLLLLWPACCCAASVAGVASGAAAADSVALLQSSARRDEWEPPAATALANGTLFDENNCPVGDDTLAFHGCPQSPLVSATRHCDENGTDSDLQEGDKEVYFMRHATPICCLDCGLKDEGVEQCEGLRLHNRFLNEGPVQVVYTSPTTRTMETALRIFADSGARFELDRRLVENIDYTHCFGCGQMVINRLAKSQREHVQEQFVGLFGTAQEEFRMSQERPWLTWDEDPPGRVKSFTSDLLKRNETRIAVVSHFHFLGSFGKALGMSCMLMGEVVVKGVLSPDGRWRRVGDSPCSGRRRRWKYGNYRRVVSSEQGEAEEG